MSKKSVVSYFWGIFGAFDSFERRSGEIVVLRSHLTLVLNFKPAFAVLQKPLRFWERRTKLNLAENA